MDDMDDKEIKAYRNGFMAAFDVKQGNFATLFGRSIEEVLDIIQNKEIFVTLFHKRQYKDYGDIRITEWPEGLVLWVGGAIVWKSWEISK